ncbi:unnamed protein product [[Candida] boidinii]|uniref:Peptide hydrolase n=1 Tax=Candida boidinii TaxID=5477 RepID=A0A9W6SXP6_CANBO|nr:unnamed protein product [[Candida] boidinii]GMG12582.1 unnamed protein product [[Candida] boidinii]
MAGNLTFTSNKVVIPHYEYPLEKSLNTEKVTSAYNDVNIYELEDMITNLTSFNDRRYNSLHGLEAATYIYDILVAYAAESPGLFHASIIHHKGWLQPSLVFTVNGISPDHIVVVGSHLDSMSYLPSFLTSAPGADDNASGVATLLESIRLLVPIFKEKIPENTIQFHFYSAEETGSLGSLEIYRYFNDQHKNKYNKKIVAMLQQDMTGYTKGSTDLGLEEHFGIVKSYASSNLNLFIKMLIQNYCDIPYRDTECSMICSDHAAATINGFPAAYIIWGDSTINGKEKSTKKRDSGTRKDLHGTTDLAEDLPRSFDRIRPDKSTSKIRGTASPPAREKYAKRSRERMIHYMEEAKYGEHNNSTYYNNKQLTDTGKLRQVLMGRR